ncbi:DegT/DnrJ/EryC1/StrS family aminotransferase [Streptomyces rubiginosohelvolus]|uniref:DegT/DnrJ/EryC1/StrS family aminotransferase n=1 Tax=Streptomyces rubiginosohelvolus TaxID=67362 RepID=UPI0036834590
MTQSDERTTLPYARPHWGDEEVMALTEVVHSGTWTSGDRVRAFEEALAAQVGADQVVCVSNGTAALHAVLHLTRLTSGSALLVTPALNFLAGPAAARQSGYDVAFTDIDPQTLNMDVESLAEVMSTHAGEYDHIVVMPVHFAGLPADIDGIVSVAHAYGATVVEDACHAPAARYGPVGPPVGGHPDTLAAVFSFHPTKPVATGEGGAIACSDPAFAERLRRHRNHNMRKQDLDPARANDTDGLPKQWYYQVDEPGQNLRMSEFHAAVGLVQLSRLPASLAHRARLAARYRAAFQEHPLLRYVPADDGGISGLHLFPVSFDLAGLGMTKRAVFDHYLRRGIAPQVHYTPLTEQPAFIGALAPAAGFPGLDLVSPGLLSLPLFHGMTDGEQDRVLHATSDLLEERVAE